MNTNRKRFELVTSASDWDPEVTCITVGPLGEQAVEVHRGQLGETGHIRLNGWCELVEFLEGNPTQVAQGLLLLVLVGDEVETPSPIDASRILSRSEVRLGVVASRDVATAVRKLSEIEATTLSQVEGGVRVYAAPHFWGKSAQSNQIVDSTDIAEVPRGEDARAQELAPVTVLAAHGRSDHLGFGNVAICGDVAAIRGGSSTEAAGSRAPQCAYGLGCFLPGNRIPVGDVAGDVLVLYSCTSGHVGSDMYERSFNLGLSAVEGAARVVIATTRAITDGGWEAALMVALLKSGIPVVEVVRVLNFVYRYVFGIPEAFICLGNPLVRLNGCLAELTTTEDLRIRVQKEGYAGILGPDVQLEERILWTSDSTIGCVKSPGGEFLVWSTAKLKQCAEFETHTYLPTEFITSSNHVIAKVKTTLAMELPPECGVRLEKIDRLAGSITAAARFAPALPYRARELQNLLDRRAKSLAGLNRLIALTCLGRGSSGQTFDLEEYFEDRFVPVGTENPVRGRVCSCGRITERIQFVSPGTGATSYAETCMQCGEVYWSTNELGMFDLDWRGPEFVSVDGDIALEMLCTNRSRWSVDVVVAPWMSARYGGSPHPRESLEPVRVDPGETVNMPLTWSVEGLPPHRYLLNAGVLINCSPTLMRRFVQVVPNEL